MKVDLVDWSLSTWHYICHLADGSVALSPSPIVPDSLPDVEHRGCT
jgi:hypothetical protein